MGKSILSIEKELLKKEHAKSPLGQVERKLRKFYDGLLLSRKKLPEEVAKKIYDIRDANEKAQLEYIERTNREHRENVDKMLLESQTAELKVIEEYLSSNQSTTENDK